MNQGYESFEHIIIDNCSDDETPAIAAKYPHVRFVSEPDEGQSDALNKGFRLATGDVIGILNSDDYYVDNTIISSVVRTLQTENTESVFGDLVYVDPNPIDKITRYYSSANFEPEKFAPQPFYR